MEFSAVWNSAPYGIQRRMEFSAVWNSAPFGIQRRLEFSAVRNSAPFGIHRPFFVMSLVASSHTLKPLITGPKYFVSVSIPVANKA